MQYNSFTSMFLGLSKDFGQDPARKNFEPTEIFVSHEPCDQYVKFKKREGEKLNELKKCQKQIGFTVIYNQKYRQDTFVKRAIPFISAALSCSMSPSHSSRLFTQIFTIYFTQLLLTAFSVFIVSLLPDFCFSLMPRNYFMSYQNV